MTKKEFKKKCKEEKCITFKLMLLGGIVSTIGLVIVLLTLLTTEGFDQQIVGFVIGIIISMIGMTLDLTGEIILSKKYKEYNKKKLQSV